MKKKDCFRTVHTKSFSTRQVWDGDRKFLVDSAASFHLISWKDLTKAERRTIRVAETPREMQTANGNVYSRHGVDVYSQHMQQRFTAYLLPQVPPVLSLGRLCK